jgi:uncharacterized protein YprB with RNaseH-like and TPR domain
MIDEALRTRLEALNRGPMPASATPPRNGAAARADGTSAAGAKRIAPSPSNDLPQQPKPHASHIPGLLRAGEPVETPFGEHLRIRLPIETLWQNGPSLVAARQEHLRSQAAIAAEAIEPTVVIDPEFASLVAALPDRTIALDLETCGLAGAALFLVGLLRNVDGHPTVELLLARNYAEEACVLATLWQTLPDYDVLVTFNGKTFDWPMVQERSVRHRLETKVKREQFTHIDILHHARRRYRKHLPNCRLQTLEWHVCRRRRADDIPGNRIPGVYAEYVRTGFERDMDTVLHHNALDLVTLYDLALRMAA